MPDIPFPNIPADELNTYMDLCRRSNGTPEVTPNTDGTFNMICRVTLPASTVGGGAAGGGSFGGDTSGGVSAAPAASPPAVSPSKRQASLDLLHPAMRRRAKKVIAQLKADGIPLKVFETFRSPERQRMLYGKGRTGGVITDKSKVVTYVDAWGSFHQYGMAMDMVIDNPNYGMWATHGQAKTWWEKYHEIARANGLTPLSFELVHVQLEGITASELRAGAYPDGGDDSWAENLDDAISRWPGSAKPPLTNASVPMPIAVRSASTGTIDWASLPPVAASGFGGVNGGHSWRVDRDGVWLAGASNPQRTPGAPLTCGRIVEVYGEDIAAASRRHRVAPELIIMTIAAETAAYRNDDFTGPRTFRWESGVKLDYTGDASIDGKERGDYSAGPMQVLSTTARWMNVTKSLGHAQTQFPWYKNKPTAPKLGALGLYDGAVATDVGTAYIAFQSEAPFTTPTGGNPILVAAAYNAGALRPSGTNNWGLVSYGDHLDRASKWFGDACAVLRSLGR